MIAPEQIAPALGVLQHALGLDQHGRGRAYRNGFVAGPGHDDFTTCEQLTAAGLMTRRRMQMLGDNGELFQATDAGRVFVREQSPPPPKLTRAQQRYQDFLDADTGDTFIDWLRRPKRRVDWHGDVLDHEPDRRLWGAQVDAGEVPF